MCRRDPSPLYYTQVSNLACTIERIFAKSEIIAPYDIITVLGGETEVIITFPTRRQCHRCDDPGSAVNNLGLNSCPTPGPGTGNIFYCKQAVAGVCTAYETLLVISAWDIAENEQRVLQFSPAGDTVLPFEVNVVRIGNSSIWNSTLAQSFGLISGFDLGWVGLNIAQGVAIQGLPAIAYLSQAFVSEEASFMVPAIYKSLIP